jgi:hypothetical protein
MRLRVTETILLLLIANQTTFAQTGVQRISETQLKPLTTTIGGATVLPTTRTITHWWGSALNRDIGITYGYNMVGANPSTCSGSDCDVTVTVDIIPVNLVVGGMTYYGSKVVAPVLASPQFALNDYSWTPFATAAGAFPDMPFLVQGPGGVLSQGDAGNQLQLQDATMRAQFNKVGSSSYHLRLNPVVHDVVTIVVPNNQGTLLESPSGVIFADVSYEWWRTQIERLNGGLGYIDPTHLPIYLTDAVLLHFGQDPLDCCVAGFHGAGYTVQANGNQPVQTFAWASWIRPGIFADGRTFWAAQDIHGISHEIAEWADDPFVNNYVEPWTALFYGCTRVLETGDPVAFIGFAMGTNTFGQGPNPNGTQSADGYYHPEDEVFLPWFMRLAPNYVSEPTQTPSTNIGRYTLMGDLNPFSGFRQPGTRCN